MAYGFETFLDGGLTQIDGNYRNMNLRKSGVLHDSDFSLGGYGNRVKSALVSTAGMNRPVVAFRTPHGQAQSRCSIERTSAGLMFYIWYNLNVGSIYYYIFDDWSPPSSGGFGLQMRNSAGALIYDSSWMRMRVVGAFNVPQNAVSSPSVSYDHDISGMVSGGVVPAVLMGSDRLVSYAHPNYFMSVMGEGFWNKDANTISSCFVTRTYGDGWWEPFTGWWQATGGLDFAVVDVRNFPTNYSGG